MERKEIIKNIQEYDWDHRVKRTGFFQSKSIVDDALALNSINLTPNLTAHTDKIVWIKELNHYDKVKLTEYDRLFEKAFTEDPDWPVKVAKELNQLTTLKDGVIKLLAANWDDTGSQEKIDGMHQYEAALLQIQKYYTIAVPLTDYCEAKLRELDESLLTHAVSYQSLDVDKHHDSLVKIKSHDNDPTMIKEHLKQYAWIKTAYNILDPYTREDVLEELASDLHESKTEEIPDSEHTNLVIGLQIGIFCRNRMKEMSQQLWFAFEKLGQSLAKDLGISRDDFFQLAPDEVYSSIDKGELTVTKEEIAARHKGFVLGYFNDERFHFTGSDVDELYDHFMNIDTSSVTELSGTTACKGIVTGSVCLVLHPSELAKLKEGQVLVTSMTTPDFIVAMKRSAAIVTDEGGLSCHAAIVSRELNIPSVIGTKIATQVLKDGMEVEVDANGGGGEDHMSIDPKDFYKKGHWVNGTYINFLMVEAEDPKYYEKYLGIPIRTGDFVLIDDDEYVRKDETELCTEYAYKGGYEFLKRFNVSLTERIEVIDDFVSHQKSVDYSKLETEKLHNLLLEFESVMREISVFLWPYPALAEGVEKYIAETVENLDFSEIRPVKKLSSEILNDQLLVAETESDFETLCQSWGWYGYNLGRSKPLDVAGLKKIKETAKSSGEIKISEDKHIHALQIFMWLKFERIDILNKALLVMEPLFVEILKRNYLDEEKTELVTPEEYRKLAQGEIVHIDFKQRVAYRGMLKIDGKIWPPSVKEWKQYRKLFPSTEVKNHEAIKELTGTTACKGVVSGIVKVVKDPEEITKVKPGDILVAHETLVQHEPYMSKVSAMVIELGGMLIHSAIFAREFNIPTVVGIAGATDILKDGMEVEVDADSGTVNILLK